MSWEAHWETAHKNPPTLSALTLTAVRTGYLVKRGAKAKTWKKRYFVLTSNLLYYYSSSTAERGFKGVILLVNCQVEELGSKFGHQNVFSITPASARHPGWNKEKNKEYYISAESETDMRAWVSAIKLQSIRTQN